MKLGLIQILLFSLIFELIGCASTPNYGMSKSCSSKYSSEQCAELGQRFERLSSEHNKLNATIEYYHNEAKWERAKSLIIPVTSIGVLAGVQYFDPKLDNTMLSIVPLLAGTLGFIVGGFDAWMVYNESSDALHLLDDRHAGSAPSEITTGAIRSSFGMSQINDCIWDGLEYSKCIIKLDSIAEWGRP